MGKTKRRDQGNQEWIDPRERKRNDRLVKQQFRRNKARVQYGVCSIETK
jgi:hypothetical protein